LQDLFEGIFRHFGDVPSLARSDTGVVNQAVDPAEFLQGFSQEPSAVFGQGDVRLDGHEALIVIDPMLEACFDRFFRGNPVAGVVDHDRATKPRRVDSYATPESSARAGDHHDREFVCHGQEMREVEMEELVGRFTVSFEKQLFPNENMKVPGKRQG
jgi:hypothetical protein